MQKVDLTSQINANPTGIAATQIIAELQRRNYQAYLVGGCVRDLLLNRAPKDFDVATNALPEQVKTVFPQAKLVGAKFGVNLINLSNEQVEVATFREEGPYLDRRRPSEVKYTDMENDSRRRDFTCNALYYDPFDKQLIAYSTGIEDVASKTLRCVGNPHDRFSEDALRILRGLRFGAQLGFEIEEVTWRSIAECLPLLHEISMERIRDEILAGLTGPDPYRYFILLEASGFFRQFLPEIDKLHGCDQPPEFHPEGDVFKHITLMMQNLPAYPSEELVLSVLFHDIAKPQTQTFTDRIRFNGHDKQGAVLYEEIGKRLRLKNTLISDVSHVIDRHMQFINLPKMRQSTLRKFLSSPTITTELDLHRLDCIASNGDLRSYEYALSSLKEIQNSHPSMLPRPLVTGEDLIKLGLPPGPEFKNLLSKIYDLQLENQISTREEGIAIIRSDKDII